MTKQEEQISLKARDLVRKVCEIPEDWEVYQREDEIVLAKQAIRAEMQVVALTHALNAVASRKLDDGPCFCEVPYGQTVHAHTPWYLIARAALSNNARQ
jgi:predicted lipid carrier protein YhbT